MAIFFQGPVGRVVKLIDPATQGSFSSGLVAVDGTAAIAFETERSIVTRVTVNHQANVQFLHTLGAHIYVYVFGDRIGALTLSGLSFAADCGDDEEEPGVARMLAWHRRNRVARRPSPVRVLVGNVPIEGFVTGFSADVVDPGAQLVQWGVNMQVLPDDDGPDEVTDNGVLQSGPDAPGEPPLAGPLGLLPFA